VSFGYEDECGEREHGFVEINSLVSEEGYINFFRDIAEKPAQPTPSQCLDDGTIWHFRKGWKNLHSLNIISIN
jgi:hypothetical protein